MVEKRGKIKIFILVSIIILSLLFLFQSQKINVTGNAISVSPSSNNNGGLLTFLINETEESIVAAYGNGTHFKGSGHEDLYQIAVPSNNNEAILNVSNEKELFITFEEEQNEGITVYHLELAEINLSNGVESADFILDNVWVSNKFVGQTIPAKGNLVVINLTYINYTGQIVKLSIRPTSSGQVYLNRIEDKEGNYFVLPNKSSFPKTTYTIEIKNNTGSIIDAYLAFWEGGAVALHQISLVASCTPNWTKQETNCYSNETKVIFYNDSKNCNNLTGKLADSIGYCDFNSNGIIGDLVNNSNTLNLTFYISGSLINSSLNYSNLSSSQLVEIKKDGQNFISFMYQFSKPLDLTNISIKFNSVSSNLGFVLVEGIDAIKSVIFDKKNESSNQVCILDDYVSSVTEISVFCDKGNEYLLSCPGTLSGYTCSITNNSFNISGLGHSGVKEMFTLATCTPNWTCSGWGGCTNSNQTRTCSDVNVCNTSASRPNLTQACITAPSVCISDWSCSNWDPVNCSNDVNQTRVCTDKNNCNLLSGKPSELNICPADESFPFKIYLQIIFVISGILLVILGVFLIIKFLSTKKISSNNPLPPVSPFSQAKNMPPQNLSPNKTESFGKTDNPGDIPQV